MKLSKTVLAVCTSIAILYSCQTSCAQNQPSAQQEKAPLEYIESSSPIPGGGVVSSVYIPGQGGPVYRGGPSSQPTAAPVGTAQFPNQAANQADGEQGQSVLDSILSGTAARTANPANTIQNRPQNSAGQLRQAYLPPITNTQPQYQRSYPVPAGGYTAYQVPAASQIPSLGVPTNWNRSIRMNGCQSCGPGAGYSPYGLGQPSAQPPQFYPGAQAAVAPTLNPRSYFGPQAGARSNYTPLFQLASFPPNAYAGQGIIGSPKLYVDGQPFRNLMRYLWIP